MGAWHRVCAADEIDDEDVVRFDLGARTFAVYNTPAGFFASDGFCTHEAISSSGLLSDRFRT